MSVNLTPDSNSRTSLISAIHRKQGYDCILMGILNITPDSFFSNSRVTHVDKATEIATKMLNNGAKWIDIGGESTRPGAKPVSVDEEISRVIPVIKQIRLRHPECMISIDTRRYEVAKLAIECGANMINDISGLKDEKMLDLVISSGCAVCIMHMQGEPGNMQNNPQYDDVVKEVARYLENQAEKLIEKGHPKELIVIDPGIGFGKTHDHNLALMKATKRFKSKGYSLLWGISRKSVIGKITGKDSAEQRLAGTIASSVYALNNGVDILRVHDIDEHNDLFNVLNVLNN